MILGGAYFALAWVGFLLPAPPQVPAAIWPASGLALAALYRFGLRYWPGVLLGAFAVALTQVSVGPALGMAVGSTLATVGAAAALRRGGFDPTFGSQCDPLWFVTLGAIAPAAFQATHGVLWLTLDGLLLWSDYGQSWIAWWLAEVMGVLLVAPVLLSWPTLQQHRRHLPARWVELGIAFVTAVGMGLLTVGPVLGNLARKYPLFVLPPLLVLAVTVRYRVWVGAVCVVLIALVALTGATRGDGVFVPDPASGLLKLWGYLGGLMIGVLVIAAVVAARDRSEARLQASEELYRSLVEDSAAMICRLGPDGAITFANDTYLKAYRTNLPAILNKAFVAVFQPEDRGRLMAVLAGLQPGGAAESIEVLAPGGRLRWHKWTFRAIGTPDRPVAGFQAVGLDVTDRTLAEQERRALEAQLFQAQKLESLGVMAGGIAHDFNNILTGILGHAELASEETVEGTPIHEHLVRISEAARRAADRVRQLLSYAGKGPITPRVLDLNAVVRDTTELVAVSLPKRCRIEFSPASDLPPVEVDEVQIRQVLTNLIVNAVEAIGERGGVIRLSTSVVNLGGINSQASSSQTVLAPGRYVALRVADTGSGMDEATRARIFDPFFSTKFAGRGLGLAAVHGIIRAHRGTVEVQTALGKGTEFSVLLPPAEINEAGPPTTTEEDTAVTRITPAPRRY